MKDRADSKGKETILFISHDASRTGAPVLLLNIMRWLRANIPNKFRVILRKGGSLESEFRKIAEVFSAEESIIPESCLRDVCLIYSNTITNGAFINSLPYGDTPVITHVHELDYMIDCYGEENIRDVKQHSIHFIACSKATAASLNKAQGIDADKISMIPGAVYPSEITDRSKSPGPVEIRNSLGISSDAFVVIGCGTLDLRKGVDLFIQLAEYCARKKQPGKELVFLWIGSTAKDPISDILKRDARKLQSLVNLQFLGEKDNPFPYIAASDLFCLPSREDPFPLVMLEAGALGKPTLAFERSGGAEEYCARGGGFLVSYLDVASMGDWILSNLMEENVLPAAGEKAQKLIQNVYSMEITGPEVASLIAGFMKPGASLTTGTAQVFIPSAAGYSEDASVRRQIIGSRWNRMAFYFRGRRLENNWSVRVDPLDRTSVIEIARIILRSVKRGNIVWRAKTPEDFNAVHVGGNAIRLPDAKVLKLLSLGSDPILCLPDLAIGEEEQEFKLEVVLRADASDDALAPHWPQLLQAYREYRGLCSDVAQLRTQLTDAVDKTEKLGLALLSAQAPLTGRDVYIWGIGSAGRHIADVMLRHGQEFRGFIDRDRKNTNQQIMDHSIFEPIVLAHKSKKKPFIIIGSQFHLQISRRLKRKGFVPEIDFAPSPFL